MIGMQNIYCQHEWIVFAGDGKYKDRLQSGLKKVIQDIFSDQADLAVLPRQATIGLDLWIRTG